MAEGIFWVIHGLRCLLNYEYLSCVLRELVMCYTCGIVTIELNGLWSDNEMVRQKIYLMNGFYKSYMVNHLVIYYMFFLTNHYYMAFISLIWLVQTKTHIGGYGSLYQTSIWVMDMCIYIYIEVDWLSKIWWLTLIGVISVYVFY